MVSGRPTKPGQQRPRRPRELARGREHHAPVTDQRQHRRDELVGDDLEPGAQRAAERGRERSARWAAAMSRSAVIRSRSSRDRLGLAQADGARPRAGHDQRGDPAVDDDVGDQGGVVLRQRGLQLVELGRLADAGRPPRRTSSAGGPGRAAPRPAGPRPYAAGSAPCSSRSSVRSRGHLLVGRRAHRRDPTDQGPGALGPLEDQRRVAVVEREPQALPGQVAAVPDERALQVEAAERGLPGVQVGEPGPHVLAGVATVAAGLGQLGPHLAPQQPRRDRGVLVDAHPVEAGRGRRRGRRGAR